MFKRTVYYVKSVKLCLSYLQKKSIKLLIWTIENIFKDIFVESDAAQPHPDYVPSGPQVN